MFDDLDWPLNASLGFVGISRASFCASYQRKLFVSKHPSPLQLRVFTNSLINTKTLSIKTLNLTYKLSKDMRMCTLFQSPATCAAAKSTVLMSKNRFHWLYPYWPHPKSATHYFHNKMAANECHFGYTPYVLVSLSTPNRVSHAKTPNTIHNEWEQWL